MIACHSSPSYAQGCYSSMSKNAQFPIAFNKLQGEFHFSVDSLQKVFMLPHKVALEPFVKAFQYNILKILSFIPTLDSIKLASVFVINAPFANQM